jgi:hypothetical protein
MSRNNPNPRTGYGINDDMDDQFMQNTPEQLQAQQQFEQQHMQQQQAQQQAAPQNLTPTPPVADLTPREQQLQSELNTLRQQLREHQLQSEVNILRQQLATQPQVQLTQPSSSAKEPKVTDPEMYSGKREKTRQFLVGLKRVFLTQPSRFNTEHAKVLYSLGRLSDSALSWSIPLQENNSPLLSSFATFEQALIEAFGVLDKKQDAIRKLRALRQGSQATSQYASNFSRLQYDTGFNDEALRDQFYQGLSDHIKDVLAQQLVEPTTLNELVKLAIRIDNRLFERRQERQHNPTSSSKTNSSSNSKTLTYDSSSTSYGRPNQTSSSNTSSSKYFSGSSSSGPTPMQLDNVSHRGPLSQEEKDRRVRDGCCKYCGEKGHFVDTCPKKPKRSVHAVTSNSDSPSDRKGKGRDDSDFRDDQSPPPSA